MVISNVSSSPGKSLLHLTNLSSTAKGRGARAYSVSPYDDPRRTLRVMAANPVACECHVTFYREGLARVCFSMYENSSTDGTFRSYALVPLNIHLRRLCSIGGIARAISQCEISAKRETAAAARRKREAFFFCMPSKMSIGK